jgi:hypothetical protein
MLSLMVLAAALNGAAPRPASDCVWAKTPAAAKAALLKRFDAGSLKLSGILDADQAVAIAVACQLPQTSENAGFIAEALRARTSLEYALKGIRALNLPEGRLQEAWDSLRPETRTALAHAFSPGFNPAEAVYADLEAAAQKAGLEGVTQHSLLFDYVCGRAVLERLR